MIWNVVLIVFVSTTTFSYESKINGDRSLLDHFLVSDNTFYAITEYTSLHHGQNLSDNNAFRLVLDIDVNYVVLSDLEPWRYNIMLYYTSQTLSLYR